MCLEAEPADTPIVDDDLVIHFGTGERCGQCNRPVTPEGLGVRVAKRVYDLRTVEEFGRNDTVIHQYTSQITLIDGNEIDGTWREARTDGPDFLISVLFQLQNQCQALDDQAVTPITASLRWNRKAAARRFRRWAKESILLSESATRHSLP